MSVHHIKYNNCQEEEEEVGGKLKDIHRTQLASEVFSREDIGWWCVRN